MTLEELTIILEAKAATLRASIVDMVGKRTLNTQANNDYLAAQAVFAAAQTDFNSALLLLASFEG